MSYFISAGGIGGPVPENADDFRKKAALCARMARQTRNPEVRRELEELTQGWLRLAEHAERSGPRVQFVSRKTEDE